MGEPSPPGDPEGEALLRRFAAALHRLVALRRLATLCRFNDLHAESPATSPKLRPSLLLAPSASASSSGIGLADRAAQAQR